MRLKLASRKSDLARWQAVKVALALESLAEKPSIEFIFKSSFGDQNLDIPLAGMGSRGVFTEDFYKDLQQGQCDLVVHSWKDLPIDEREDTLIAMTLPRADVRDLLLIPESVWQQSQSQGSLKVLTSSPRRVYNLKESLAQLLPGNLQIQFQNVRGNVPTRLTKMHEERAALILAKAGLDRLLEAEDENFFAEGDSVRARIQNCRFVVLPVSLNPPAPAQGALAVEVSETNPLVRSLCERLTDKETYSCVQQERAILKNYGGGCHQKIGVARLPREYGTICALRGQTEEGEILKDWRIENTTPWVRATATTKVFPLRAEDNSWFVREPVAAPAALKTEQALFVARANAWPLDFRPSSKQVVWTAGLQTWKKLVEKGIFINGCQDGLGESEEKHLTKICGNLKWTKLTHDLAADEGLATYRLKPKTDVPDLHGKTHFFWMSRTSFERAFELYPKELQQGYNSCGPGLTWEFLKTFEGLKNPIKVFMGLEQFLHESLP